MRSEIWEHPSVIIGGSDAGAHLDRMAGATYTTQWLDDCLHGRRLTTTELEIVHDLPADSRSLWAQAAGIRRVLVNGVTTLIDDEANASLPGKILQSGTDTRTVPLLTRHRPPSSSSVIRASQPQFS